MTRPVPLIVIVAGSSIYSDRMSEKTAVLRSFPVGEPIPQLKIEGKKLIAVLMNIIPPEPRIVIVCTDGLMLSYRHLYSDIRQRNSQYVCSCSEEELPAGKVRELPAGCVT